jgi:hypothetical protein
MTMMRIILLCVCLAAFTGLAQNSPVTGVAPAVSIEQSSRSEQIRTACIAGRRRICGKVLQITPAGLVVDSGYTNLLNPPLNHSWVTRGTAVVARPSDLLEATAPDSVAVGLVFVTDFPRRPKPHRYDYVALIGYPAGNYDYVPVAGVKKTIRRFTGGLERAVTLTLQAESK